MIAAIPNQLPHIYNCMGYSKKNESTSIVEDIQIYMHGVIRGQHRSIGELTDYMCMYIAALCEKDSSIEVEARSVVPDQRWITNDIISLIRFRFKNKVTSREDLDALDIMSHIWYQCVDMFYIQSDKTYNFDMDDEPEGITKDWVVNKLTGDISHLLGKNVPSITYIDGEDPAFIVLYQNGKYDRIPFKIGDCGLERRYSDLVELVLKAHSDNA